MKLLIKLYKPEGTCEEIPFEGTVDYDGFHKEKPFGWQEPYEGWYASRDVEKIFDAMSDCVSKGGRFEVAPIVE